MAIKVHWRNINLRVETGACLPECYYGPFVHLNMERTKLPTTGDSDKVTCKRCIEKMTAMGYDPDDMKNKLPHPDQTKSRMVAHGN